MSASQRSLQKLHERGFLTTLTETVMRPEDILMLPPEFVYLNLKITSRGHTGCFEVNFDLKGLLIHGVAISHLHC